MNLKLFSLFLATLLIPGMLSPLSLAQGESAKPVLIEVCDVALPPSLLETRPADEVMRFGAGDEVEAISPVDGQEWIAPMDPKWHPFLEAAHRAFADHRPLALSPDMIWQLLVQMAAEEVLAAPEKHRSLFADHSHGSRTLEVRRDHFILGRNDNNWPGVFAELERNVVSKVPGSPAEHFAHAFSTSTPTEVAARQVVLLKAASPYYNYQLSTMCGIPRIELHGTAEDWRWIRDKVAGLRTFNMERRVKALMPVLDECLSAAEGKADPAFWKSYYKYASESGSSYVSGWINVFFVKENDKLLDVVLAPQFSWSSPPKEKKDKYAPDNLPLALTTRSYKASGAVDVDFVWQYFEQTIPMRWRAGFMGVAQDRETMTLRPVIAWQVLRSKLSNEERMAADYLSGVKQLDMMTLYSIGRGFAVNPKSGFIRHVKIKFGDPLDSRFWKKAFPLMVRLQKLDVSEFLNIQEPEEQKALIEAMLSAPSVKVVTVPTYLEPEYLRILQERKDWKIVVE